MATKVRRGKSFCVVYLTNGKQKWETYKIEADADARIREIGEKKALGNFVPPNPTTISEFLAEYVEVYGVAKWSHSTYSSNTSLIRNYINPLIGAWRLRDVNTKKMDSFFVKLKSQPAAKQHADGSLSVITDRCVYDVNLLLSNAFCKAVEWEYIGKNPITRNACPDRVDTLRGFWTPDIAKAALAACTDLNLLVSMHLAIACSMRIGEITGLRWQFVTFGDADNGFDNAALQVTSQLQRISRETFETLHRKKSHIKLAFPGSRENAMTMLVLKTPKTKSSERIVWIPQTLASALWELKKRQEELQAILGNEYQNYDMVIAQDNGSPIEGKRISDMFKRFVVENGFPCVEFHSLRHLSTTVKLLISQGDVKSVQGETGHSQAKMVTDTYAHILDQNRRTMARKFEELFYKCDTFNNRPSEISIELILALLIEKPESVELLKNILSTK